MSRAIYVLVVALSIACASASATSEDPQFEAFQQFLHRFNKSYATPAEFVHRYNVFLSNMERVKELTAEHEQETGTSAEGLFGVTKFSDLTFEEFKSQWMGFKPSANRAQILKETPVVVPKFGAPSQVDWREKGVVTAVKNQGQCGSCWAFSATEEIESMWAVEGNKLEELSVQQIVSCDDVDAGCNGGDTITAYQYVKKAGGLEPESTYPYTSGGGDDGTCKDSAKKEIVGVASHSYATPGCSGACNNQNETQLAANLAEQGPVSICVNANDKWQNYVSGVLKTGCPHAESDLDHCVQLVGYNEAGADKYWIVRNSWAADWGESGYIYLKMGENLCGVADEATFVKAVAATK